MRDAYAAHIGAVYGAAFDAANIHITSGCNQAFICAVMAVAGAGDAVLLTNPFYFNHETTLSMLGIGVRMWCARLNAGFFHASKILRRRSILSKGAGARSPNNPTGAVYPAELLAEIAELCRNRGIWLILDETYRDFLPQAGRAPHGLFTRPDWQDYLVSLYSFFQKASAFPSPAGCDNGGACLHRASRQDHG